MRRIAQIADSHFCEESRWDECCRLHDWIANDIAARDVDLILHSGDVFDRKSNPRERLWVARWLARCATVAPVVLVRGNHDALGDLEIFGKLETEHPILVVETCGIVHAGGCAVACLAWPRRAELVAHAGIQVSPEMANQFAADALRQVLTGMGAELAEFDGPRILLAHAMVRGSVTSTGQPLVGCDMEIGIEDLALARADFVALGHIHKGQDWQHDGVPIVYPGSPRRTAFGEVEEKAYVIAEFSPLLRAPDNTHLQVTWQRVPVPATRMLLGEDEFAPGRSWLCHGLSGEGVKGAEVRFRYTVDADHRDAAKAAAETMRDLWLEEGAVSVKLEEVVRATTRARTPEITTATTLPEKLDTYWRAKGITVDAERRPRVLGKLAELEGA